MSSFNAAPTVVLPPAPDHHFIGNHYLVNGISPNGLASSNAAAFASNATAPGPIAGRKRSPGDIFSQDDDEAEHLDDGSVHDPDSSFGTSAEERAAERPFNHAKRPSVTSRKSQRMDSTASGQAANDLAQLVLPPQMRDVTTEPLIDEATRSLGISWTRMDSSEALLINQAAYGKWIQNHYPSLNNVTIWFENSALPGYLAQCHNAYNGQQEYYIFSHDLTEARLVTTEPSQLLPRLKMLPALHLAAPGGHLRAETDPITASQNELNGLQVDMVSGAAHENQPSGACAAHAMELD